MYAYKIHAHTNLDTQVSSMTKLYIYKFMQTKLYVYLYKLHTRMHNSYPYKFVYISFYTCKFVYICLYMKDKKSPFYPDILPSSHFLTFLFSSSHFSFFDSGQRHPRRRRRKKPPSHISHSHKYISYIFMLVFLS